MPLPTPSPSGGFLRTLGMGMGNREALLLLGVTRNISVHSISFPYGPERELGVGAGTALM